MKRWRCVRRIVAVTAALWLTACALTRHATPAGDDLQVVDTLNRSEEFGEELLTAARIDARHADLRRYGIVLSRDYGRRHARIKRWRDTNFAGTSTSIRSDPHCSAMQYARAETVIGGDMAILNDLVSHRECLLGMATEAAKRTSNTRTKSLLNALAENYSRELQTLRGWRDTWGR